MPDQNAQTSTTAPTQALSKSAWLAHLEWLKELTYNYSHDECCSGWRGPPNEGWVEHDKCDCWHKEIWDLIEANTEIGQSEELK